MMRDKTFIDFFWRMQRRLILGLKRFNNFASFAYMQHRFTERKDHYVPRIIICFECLRVAEIITAAAVIKLQNFISIFSTFF